MDHTVHGTLQARILERVAYHFSSGSFRPRHGSRVSCTAGGFFTSWATRIGQRGNTEKKLRKKENDWSCISFLKRCSELEPGSGEKWEMRWSTELPRLFDKKVFWKEQCLYKIRNYLSATNICWMSECSLRRKSSIWKCYFFWSGHQRNSLT